MKQFSRNGLTVAIAVLMSACAANKGDFGVNTVTPTQNTTQPSPTLQDIKTEPRTQEEVAAIMEPGLGFQTKLLERNTHPRKRQDENSVYLTSDKIQVITNDFESLEQKYLETLEVNPRKKPEHIIHGTHKHDDGFFASRNREYMKFVKSGWIANLTLDPIIHHDTDNDHANSLWFNGMDGYVFYLGKNPATALPSSGQVNYKGTWDFATSAKKNRRPATTFTRGAKMGAGNNYSAFSFHESVDGDEELRERESKAKGPVTHSSEFTVDFDKKTLTGKLKYNKGSKTTQDRYSVDAQLFGNRFRGKAISEDKSHAHFGADSNTLEGGFFGPNAEELAGKFLADDNSLFGVFAARQLKNDQHIEENGAAAAEAAFDATKLDLQNYQVSGLDTFGNATKLVINGRSFSLLPEQATTEFLTNRRYEQQDGNLVINACCNNLDYVKFGNYFTEKDSAQSNAHLFITGERTPISQMHTAGEFDYLGTWEARVLTAGGKVGAVTPDNKTGGAKAHFAVNFDKKTLAGALHQEGGSSPSVLIQNGTINGNGFNAIFNTRESGFLLDRVTNDVAHASGVVMGAFYGPRAAELGGYLYSNTESKDKMIGVFGAKQQVLENK